MRLLFFAAMGTVLGYLYFSWVRLRVGSIASHCPPGRQAVLEMVVRLVAFALVLALLLYRFGSLAGIAVLVGMVLARSLMTRAELKPRGR